jgi:hypothetical protein
MTMQIKFFTTAQERTSCCDVNENKINKNVLKCACLPPFPDDGLRLQLFGCEASVVEGHQLCRIGFWFTLC